VLDDDEPLRRIPAERMKVREAHIVRVGQQSVDILEALVPITGHQRCVSANDGGGRPMSENTLNGAIRRLGHSGDEMTSHSSRSMASTLLSEQDVHSSCTGTR
jgi:integrase